MDQEEKRLTLEELQRAEKFFMMLYEWQQEAINKNGNLEELDDLSREKVLRQNQTLN